MTRHKLIAIEGIDGAGTTTQTARLATRFGLHATREPSDRPIGRELRAILRGERGDIPEAAVALLFAADRVDHVVNEIRAQACSVITDRYLLSSLVYQSLSLPRDFVATINQHAPHADLTILVDVPAEVAAHRRATRGGVEERYDADETQRRLVEAYRREIALVPGGVIVDGTGSADDVFERLVPIVHSCLVEP